MFSFSFFELKLGACGRHGEIGGICTDFGF